MENFYHDTYFFDAQTALKEALKKNKTETQNPRFFGLQICYYNAEEPLVDVPINCIWVPLENVYNHFITTKNRVPEKLDFENSTFNQMEQVQLRLAFNEVLEKVKNERLHLCELLIKELCDFKPDFKDSPLRILVPACRETVVMQHSSKSVANSLKKIGYMVEYFIQDNAMQSCTDLLPFLHKAYEFKPHIIFNINHLSHYLLNENTMNIVWFQDPMSILDKNASVINIRKNDIIYALTEKLVDKKIDTSKYEIQKVCVDTDVFTRKKEIKKENKIVFLGSSYAGLYMGKESKQRKKLYNLFKDMLNENKKIDKNFLNSLSTKYDISVKDIILSPLAAAVREITVEWMCKQTIIEKEVYGFNWEHNETIKPFFKGTVSNGEEVAKVYNSSKYALSSHPSEMYLNRLLEMSACESIPILFDARDLDSNTFTHEDEVLIFSTYEEFVDCLKKEPKISCTEIAQEMSYDQFAKRISKKIEEKLKI